MTDKAWYKSKGKIGAVVAAVGGLLTILGGYLSTGELNMEALIGGVSMLGVALGIFGVRDAEKK